MRRRRAEMAQKREIGPGLEMPAGAPQHDAAQGWGAFQSSKGRDQPIDQRAVIGVADLGPVQDHPRDAAPVDLA